MKSINLGKNGLSTEVPAPAGPLNSKSSKPAKPVYPSLYLDSDDPDFPKLPDSGTMVVKFSLRRASVDKGGNAPSVSITLDIEKILAVKPDEEKSASDILDDLASCCEDDEDGDESGDES